MKVVIVGATGRQGKGVLTYLLKQKDISQVVVGARRLDSARELASSLDDNRIRAKFIDIVDIRSSAEVFKGADVVVNCAYEGYTTDDNYMNLELTATKAALEAGVNYVGLGGAPAAPEQLALSDEFESKGILAILGMGILTGLIQIMAAYAINRLNKTDSVDMRYGERDLVPPEQYSQPLALGPKLGATGKPELSYGFLNSTRFRYSARTVSYDNGELHYGPPRGNPEPFTFRDPIGTLTVAQTAGSAVISLSRSFPNISRISLKTGGNPESDKKVNLIRDLGFFGNEPTNVKGQTILPWDVFVALIEKLPTETKLSDIRSEARVIVCGKEARKEVEYTVSWIKIKDGGPREYVVSSSGLCAAIAAMMLARGQAKGKGVLMPEICIPPEQYLEEFANEGMEIEIVRKVRL